MQDFILMARKRKPSGRNKKERRRKQGIILPNEVNHDRNAGIAHGLIIGGKGGVKVRVDRKSPKKK